MRKFKRRHSRLRGSLAREKQKTQQDVDMAEAIFVVEAVVVAEEVETKLVNSVSQEQYSMPILQEIWPQRS